MNENRSSYLDGLRGLAALIVVFYHYLLSFYPALFTARLNHSHTSQNIEATIGRSIFSFLFNGNFAVCLFFVLSGYVLSMNFFFNKNRDSPVSGILKRYPRLVIPIVVSVLLSYVILLSHGYSNIQTGDYTFNNFWLTNLWKISPDFLSALKEGFIDSVFYGGNIEYNPVVWTMNVEFMGSMLVFSFLAVFGKIKSRFIIYVVLAILFYQTYFLAFILGIALCDYRSGNYYRQIPLYFTIVFLLISFYLASFKALSLNAKQNQIFYIFAAFLMIVALIHEKRFQNALSNKWLHFFGKISFSFYLLHVIILGSFTCSVFRFLYVNYALGYHISFLISFTLSMGLLIIASYFYFKYIDLKGILISEKIYDRFFYNKTE